MSSRRSKPATAKGSIPFALPAFPKITRNLKTALAAVIVGMAAAFSGCGSLAPAYQAYDRKFERELQIEASANEQGGGTGTVRFVIKRKADGKLVRNPISARGGNASVGKVHRTPRAVSFPNVINELDGVRLAHQSEVTR